MNFKYFIFVIIIFSLVFFYLKQQIEITKVQYKIKDLYDQIEVLESENKLLVLQIEECKLYKNLEEYVAKNNFIKPTLKDIKVVYY
jgi:cell division protein FtsL